jgi:hypothetical protein
MLRSFDVNFAMVQVPAPGFSDNMPVAQGKNWGTRLLASKFEVVVTLARHVPQFFANDSPVVVV